MASVWCDVRRPPSSDVRANRNETPVRLAQQKPTLRVASTHIYWPVDPNWVRIPATTHSPAAIASADGCERAATEGK